ncbi:MAG: hypothetical protein ABIO74_05275 [Dokdonella sp.]
MQTQVSERVASTALLNDDANHSGVSWAAIFAGAAAAASLSYILVILGFGLGLSSMSPWTSSGADAKALGVATIVWVALTQIAASALGGYMAGRLRVKWTNVHSDEVYFRDTAHGFLSWAVASLVVAAFLASAIGTVLRGGAQVAGAAVASAGAMAKTAVEQVAQQEDNGTGYFVDSLFRRTPDAAAAATTTSDTTSMVTSQQNVAAAHAEAARIFVNDLKTGALAPADKQYLGQVVANSTGLSQSDAEQRVDASFNSLKQSIDSAKATAKQVADDARKASAHAALWMFIALLCGAFFASLAATLGGRRRDLIIR